MVCGWKPATFCGEYSTKGPVAIAPRLYLSTTNFLPRCWISSTRCNGRTDIPAVILSFQSNPKRLASMIFNVQPGVAKPYNVKNLSLWKHLPVFCQTILTVRFSLKRLFSHYAPSLLASFSGTNLLTASINLQFTFY